MTIMYTTLKFIHICSAIVGMGPGFILSLVVKSSNTITELRHAYVIKNRIHFFVMIGGTLLLVTGLLMGAINTQLFQLGWYWAGLILFGIALAMVPFIFKPLSAPIKDLLKTAKGDNIPEEYTLLLNRLTLYENVINSLFVMIIFFMILKPF